jgi:hypothetical protein
VSIQDERELRGRLGALLDGVAPGPAPVSQAVRRGRGIRVRRWIGAAAGLAVIVAGAAVVPALLQAHTATPAAPLHYKVTVTKLGSSAAGGIIGAGTIGTEHWRVVLDRSLGDGCEVAAYVLTCGDAYGSPASGRAVSLASSSAYDTQFEIGTVGAGVTRVAIQLSNGAVLNLRPVTAAGLRWVAVAAPLRTIRRAVSYAGDSEYRYAIPYANDGVAEFSTWLRPGQAGLPRVTKAVGAGDLDGVAWHAAVGVGPWGYCASFINGSSCFATTTVPRLLSAGQIVHSLACGPLSDGRGKNDGASAGVMAVPPDVKDVVLRFAGGGRLRLAAIAVAGTRVLGYAIADRPAVIQTLEYGVHGQLVHSGSGTGWGCPPGTGVVG